MSEQTHDTKAGEGVIGGIGNARSKKPELCDCPGCTQQRLLYCERMEQGLNLPDATAPSTPRLQ